MKIMGCLSGSLLLKVTSLNNGLSFGLAVAEGY